jgi:hypothetical protein
MSWLQGRLREWRVESGHGGALLNHHHDAFDAWLAERTAPADANGQTLLPLEAA